MNIKEARAEAVGYIDALVVVAKGGARLRQAHIDNAYGALDTYALAVLDEAQKAAIAGFQAVPAVSTRRWETDWKNEPLLALRRRIEELGR